MERQKTISKHKKAFSFWLSSLSLSLSLSLAKIINFSSGDDSDINCFCFVFYMPIDGAHKLLNCDTHTHTHTHARVAQKETREQQESWFVDPDSLAVDLARLAALAHTVQRPTARRYHTPTTVAAHCKECHKTLDIGVYVRCFGVLCAVSRTLVRPFVKRIAQH